MINGIVYDGNNPQAIRDWCQNNTDVDLCGYSWTMRGWHVTVATTNGHELLHAGDSVVQVAPDRVAIVRKGDQ